MYGTVWCRDCKRAKRFLAEQRIPYAYVDIDGNAEGMAYVERANNGKHIIPTIEFPDGSLLIEPSNAELAAKLGIQTAAKSNFYDLIVIGSGPAGLTAAIYAAREGIETLVIERGGVGGQAGMTERLDNFPGFPEGVTGAEFAERLRAQAVRFGVEILAAQEVASIGTDEVCRAVRTKDGNEYRAWAVLLTLGSTYRRLGIPGEDDFIGAGVHFCATCDGAFYRERDVMVIGGGNSAGEESLFLTKFARHVTIVTQDPALTASRVVAEKVLAHPQIDVITGSTAAEFRGTKKLESVVLKNLASGELTTVNPAAVFVFIGLTPNSELVRSQVATDSQGFILTDAGMQTNVPGLFAAGDVRAGSTKQAAAAAGEGAAAALAIRRYLEPLAGGMPCRDLAREASLTAASR